MGSSDLPVSASQVPGPTGVHCCVQQEKKNKQCHFLFCLFVFCFIIHMCIQCLGHFSLLPPPPPLPPTISFAYSAELRVRRESKKENEDAVR
jgi:hypothetical protein